MAAATWVWSLAVGEGQTELNSFSSRSLYTWVTTTRDHPLYTSVILYTLLGNAFPTLCRGFLVGSRSTQADKQDQTSC